MSSAKKSKGSKKKRKANRVNEIRKASDIKETEDITKQEGTSEAKEELQTRIIPGEAQQKQKGKYSEKLHLFAKHILSLCSAVEQKCISGLKHIKVKASDLQNETKGVLLISSVIVVALFITVITLGVRLCKVTNELKAVQVMSTNLQEELTRSQSEQQKKAIVSEKGDVPDKNVLEMIPTQQVAQESTEKPSPTQTPELTEKPTPTQTPKSQNYIVCVDAGHGDWDGGAVLREDGIEKRIEKEDNLRLALLFRDALKEYGIEVVMTRETDVFLELSERTDIANAANADALISFHRNSFNGENEVSGIEFWIHSSRPEGADTLAQSMLDAVMQVGGMKNRGVKSGAMSGSKDNYAINRAANMTSMIVEFGFITSQSDNAAYDANGEVYAKEMAKAVYEWLEAQEADGQ
ncbi:MAG: N-acetylmuramoyl-L-alanine amidase [Lachnospiraceae bacterium]|nr:N-acetylmuramoyl-L-alanine amidase [Lachnospiraceae bacterium]